MLMVIFLLGAALFILLGCCIVFWRKKTHGLLVYFLLGWLLQILLSLPAGIWQAVNGWPDIGMTGTPLWVRLLLPLVGWPFNTGGYTVRCVFEATVGPLEWLVGNRTSTVLTNMPYYLFLMAVQVSALALIFAVRYKRRKTVADWLTICLAILFLINSFTNVRWLWAGT